MLMSSDSFDLVAAAKLCALAACPMTGEKLYAFTKAGVMLDDLLPLAYRLRIFFDVPRG